METYLVIITTALVVTQIVRIAQNTIQLRRQNRLIRKELEGLPDVTDADIRQQRKARRLEIEFFEKVLGSREHDE